MLAYAGLAPIDSSTTPSTVAVDSGNRNRSPDRFKNFKLHLQWIDRFHSEKGSSVGTRVKRDTMPSVSEDGKATVCLHLCTAAYAVI